MSVLQPILGKFRSHLSSSTTHFALRDSFKQGQPAQFALSYMVGREDKRTNNRTMLPTLKNNAAAGYKGPVKIELLKGAGLLFKLIVHLSL